MIRFEKTCWSRPGSAAIRLFVAERSRPAISSASRMNSAQFSKLWSQELVRIDELRPQA